MLVNSTWGLGEGLVAGVLEADVFILDAAGNIIQSTLTEKQITVYGAGGGPNPGSLKETKYAAEFNSFNKLRKSLRWG
jgi:phosphoenolpyruvate synthase/pyruvate phosphate dikinase